MLAPSACDMPPKTDKKMALELWENYIDMDPTLEEVDKKEWLNGGSKNPKSVAKLHDMAVGQPSPRCPTAACCAGDPLSDTEPCRNGS